MRVHPNFAGIFAGSHYWQSWPWAAFDDDAAASTSRKRNIALRAAQGLQSVCGRAAEKMES